MKTYKEKIGNQWYLTKVETNGSMKDVPLLGRIFGHKEIECDQKWDDEKVVKIYNIIYRGVIYIYKEIITTRIKIDGPKDNSHDQEFYKKVLTTVNFESNEEKICINCEYGLEPRKCFNLDIIALQGGYTKAKYVKLSKKDYNFIQLDKNCTGFKMIEKRRK